MGRKCGSPFADKEKRKSQHINQLNREASGNCVRSERGRQSCQKVLEDFKFCARESTAGYLLNWYLLPRCSAKHKDVILGKKRLE